MADVLDTHTKILERMDDRLVEIGRNLTDTRERVIRMEAKDTDKKVVKLADRVERHGNRLTRIETRGAFVVAGLSLAVSAVAAFVVNMFKT